MKKRLNRTYEPEQITSQSLKITSRFLAIAKLYCD